MLRALLAWVAVSCAFSAAGCNRSADAEPEAPTCGTGFRSQCIVDVSVGASFGCAVLGYPTTDLCPEDIGGGKTKSVACHTFPFRVVGLDGATAIASGDAFSCAVLTDGSVRCWGGNAVGELGNGATVTSQSPVQVGAL